MTVSSVELFRVRMPLRHPHRAAHGREELRSSILVRVGWEGAVGWGECPALAAPTYTAEYHDGAWAVLRDHVVPAVLAPETQPSRFGAVGHPMAVAGFRDALRDAQMRASDTSLVDRLGLIRRPVPACSVVSITDSIDDLVAAVAAAPGAVKLKIRPGWDLEPLRAVRAAFPDRELAADANGSYRPDFSNEVRAAVALEEIGLTYLEQPHAGIVANAALAKALATPIALDEPIDSLESAELALAAGALAVLNVKPARVGGVSEAVRLLRWARRHGVDAFVGGMLETGVGRATAAALALHPGATLPTDLGPSSRYWDADLTEPILADDAGSLLVPVGPGIGVAPDPGRLAAATVEHLAFTP